MKITFLGTGTSFGIPIIGCTCEVCTSTDPRNRRRRASILVEVAGEVLLVDTPPDLREQALEHDVKHIDAVLITHAHADHIFGFDDLRSFYVMNGIPLPVYAAPNTIDALKRIFAYVEGEIPKGASVLRVDFNAVQGPFAFKRISIEPLPVYHGKQLIYGYRFEHSGQTLGYVPDCSAMPETTLARVRGIDVMILDALQPAPHPTHFTLEESVQLLEKIGAGTSYITHLGHALEHVATQNGLPTSIHVPYDGLTLQW